ncbi:transposable element Tc3 transposase [Trichonephila clavipes]|nr:transposable element Tc3 transposase [Trichonephila clavipes]
MNEKYALASQRSEYWGWALTRTVCRCLLMGSLAIQASTGGIDHCNLVGSTASLSEHVQLHSAGKNVESASSLLLNLRNQFQTLTEAYGKETLSRAHELSGTTGFQEEESVWKMTNLLGIQVNFCLKGTHFTSVEKVQGKTENLLKGLPEPLPAMFVLNAERSTFDQVSEFDRGRIVAYQNCGLSFRKIGSRVGRNQTTVKRICDRWMQEGTTDRRRRLHPPHRCLRSQWCDERRIWVAEWNEVVFTDESHICLQHHDGRIRVRIHRGERMLNSCVMHRHTGPAPGIMVWGGIGYHSRTPLVCIAGTLNSQHYISEVLEPVVLPYLQGLATAIFQQDNTRLQVAHVVKTFFVHHQIELLLWPVRSPDVSPIKNTWSMVAQRLTQITPPAATPDQLWQRVVAAWSAVPQEHTRSLFFESMPRRVAAVISNNGDYSGY